MLCVSAPSRENISHQNTKTYTSKSRIPIIINALRLCVFACPPLTNTINNLVLYPKQSPSRLCALAPLREKPPLTNTPRLTLLNPEYPSSSMLCDFAPLRENISHQNTKTYTSKSRIPIIIKALRLCVKKPRILFLYPKQSPSRLCVLAPSRETISHQNTKTYTP